MRNKNVLDVFEGNPLSLSFSELDSVETVELVNYNVWSFSFSKLLKIVF